MEDIKNIQDDNVPNNENSSSKKSFTQEEVNSIVQKRIFKEKNRGNDTNQNERIEEREKLLLERELKADCREALTEANLSNGFLELFNGTTKEELDNFIETVKKINDEINKRPDNRFKAHTPPNSDGVRIDPIKSAFKPPII